MIPKLYGDGIHDDQPALQAAHAGKPIEIMNNCAYWKGGMLYLRKGTTCRVERPIQLTVPSYIRISSANIQSETAA